LLSYYKWAIARGVRKTNPALSLPSWRPPKSVPKPLPFELVRPFVAQVFSHSFEIGTLSLLYLHTGLRLNELRLREWRDLSGGQIWLPVKGGARRAIYLNAEAFEALTAWRERCPLSRWMFPSRQNHNEPISEHRVWAVIRQSGLEVGIDGCRPHRLRHTFATELYRQTRDLLLVKIALGHEAIASTLAYTQLPQFGVQDALSQLHY
jgi:integrase